MADLSLNKHMLSEALRKSLRPARRQELAGWFQDTFQVNGLRPVVSHSSVALPGIDAVERTISPRYACAFALASGGLAGES